LVHSRELLSRLATQAGGLASTEVESWLGLIAITLGYLTTSEATKRGFFVRVYRARRVSAGNALPFALPDDERPGLVRSRSEARIVRQNPPLLQLCACLSRAAQPRQFNPSGKAAAARKDERMDAIPIDDRQFEVNAKRCACYRLPHNFLETASDGPRRGRPKFQVAMS
jgi:hypothetical protein